MRSSALFLAAHKHKLARPARCRVVCCVFWFLGPPRALFCSISQHTGQVLRLPLGHPAGTVLRFLVFRPGLGSVSPNIAAHRRLCLSTLTCRHRTTLHPRILTCCRCLILSLPAACHRRRSVCCVFRFLASPWIPFHPISQHTGRVLRLPLGHPAGTVLRFLVFRPGLGSVSPNIAAHRRGSWLYACRRSPVGTALPFILTPSPVAGVSFSLRPPPSPICVLRFLVFRPAPSPVSPNIAAHRQGFASAPRSSGRYCAAFSGN